MNGPVTVNNDVTAGGKSLTGHTHGGVQSGSATLAHRTDGGISKLC